MPTPNLPNNPDNYALPSKLSVWFAPKQADGTLAQWRDLGNTMDISLALNEEYLEHMSAHDGVQAIDKEVINALKAEIKFSVDELVGCNLLLVTRPATSPDSTAVDKVLQTVRIPLSGTTAEVIDDEAFELASTDYAALQWDFKDGNGYVDDVLVRSLDGSVTYTDGVDYTFTQAAGTGTGSGHTPATIARVALGGIADGQHVHITYAYDRQATEYRLQEGVILEGALRVQALNKVGPMYAWQFDSVSIHVDGEIAINPAEFMKAGFMAKVLTDGRGRRGSLYIYDRFASPAAAAACT